MKYLRFAIFTFENNVIFANVSTYDESKYIYWCNPKTPINRGKLGSSQPWRYKKERGFYD